MFADVANMALFDGEYRIKPDQLAPASISSIMRFTADDILHETSRDVAMFLSQW